MNYPSLTDEFRRSRLNFLANPPTGKLRMVLDTDTYNEVDDQFAVAYALLSPERLTVEALYAAPFLNERSSGPADGMEKSYEEILRLLDRLKTQIPTPPPAFRGSTRYMTEQAQPERSAAVEDLIQRALASPDDDPLMVVAIGAITNIANAIRLEPEIIKHIVLIWLGGQPHALPWANEFNLQQDIPADQTVFDCGVPFAQIPCMGVASHLLTTVPELELNLKGRNPISDFLLERFCAHERDHFAWAKEIWDISAIAWLLNERWTPSLEVPAPYLTEEIKYRAPEAGRHIMRAAYYVDRNAIFRDMFTKLQKA